MAYEDLEKNTKDVIYLAGCSVKGTIPDRNRIDSMDLDAVYSLAIKHMIGTSVAMALESAGFIDKLSRNMVGRAIRKNALFDKSWQEISARLEEAGIWYMPLKGAVLKKYYPNYGMREFSDYDVLFDTDWAEDVKVIMENLGFTTKKFGNSNHDVYLKPPVLNFEMHKSLFAYYHGKKLYEHYKDIGKYLIGDESCERHFTPEDFYVYMVAHEYRHYSGGGTCLRSLLDTYVYLNKKNIDMDYVDAETKKIGIDAFEKQNRSLSLHLIDGESLTEEEGQMLDYILASGTYGTIQNRVQNKMDQNRWGKARYTLFRITGPISRKNKEYERFAEIYPFIYKHKVLMPFLMIYRILRSMKSGKLMTEVKAIRGTKKKQDQEKEKHLSGSIKH